MVPGVCQLNKGLAREEGEISSVARRPCGIFNGINWYCRQETGSEAMSTLCAMTPWTYGTCLWHTVMSTPNDRHTEETDGDRQSFMGFPFLAHRCSGPPER